MANENFPYLIEYTVGLNYITPAARQRVGMSGNHNAVEVKLTVDSALMNELESDTATTVKYRFEIYNAAGEIFRTETQLAGGQNIFNYSLQERDTRYSGTVKVILVFVAFDGDTAVREVFCPPALLQFTGNPHGTSRVSYSELELKALDAADKASDVYEAFINGELIGEKGDSYVLTETDKVEIAETITGTVEYYTTLSGAIADCNNDEVGVNADAVKGTAVASVVSGDIITLLKDTTEAAVIEVADDITLDLNGKCLSFGTGAHFEVTNGANFIINGDKRESKIEKIVSTTASEYITYISSGAVIVNSGEYEIVLSDGGNARVFRVQANTSLTLKECAINVDNPNGQATSILNFGTVTAINTKIITDSISGSGEVSTRSVGIVNQASAELYLYNCEALGTFSGIQSCGTLYINGGTYKGVAHGGMYLCATDKNSYIENAVISHCKYWGNHKNRYDYLIDYDDCYGMYIKGGTATTVYFDNCEIEGGAKYALCYNTDDGKVFMSNCRLSHYPESTTELVLMIGSNSELYLGFDNNITSDDVYNSRSDTVTITVTSTDDIYAKSAVEATAE